jgi:hypothetical protein
MVHHDQHTMPFYSPMKGDDGRLISHKGSWCTMKGNDLSHPIFTGRLIHYPNFIQR